jgi:hypothetical protein
MLRHWPSLVLTEMAESARVAVSSRGFASAAADGLRIPPARETLATSVFATGVAAVAEGAGVIDAAGAELAAAGDEAAAGAGAAAAAPPKVKSWSRVSEPSSWPGA